MRRLSLCLVLTAMLARPAVAQTPGEPDPQAAEDIQTLQAAKVGTDSQALLEWLRRQTLKEDERLRLGALVKRLGDPSYQKREKAIADVIAVGPRALPVLREALPGATLEMSKRLQRCLTALEKDSPALVAGAAVRTVKLQRPPGACGVLLAYLTSAPDANVEEEVMDAVAGLGTAHGPPEAAFEPALTDPSPARRGAAALVLGRAGSRVQRQLVHLLLDDPHPAVRLRAAQGLLLGRDKSAVPALIGLLREAPLAVAEQAEDVLTALAGKSSPATGGVSDDSNARAKTHAAWRAWWEEHGPRLDLARTDLDALSSKNPGLRARDTARQFIAALFKNDKALTRKTSELPFVIGGFERVETQEMWDQLLSQVNPQEQRKDTKLVVQKVITVDEYAKIAPKEELAFVESVRKQPVRVVVGDVMENGNRMEQFALFVRVTGARARVIGLGIPRPVGLK
jgi:hypothetical protein